MVDVDMNMVGTMSSDETNNLDEKLQAFLSHDLNQTDRETQTRAVLDGGKRVRVERRYDDGRVDVDEYEWNGQRFYNKYSEYVCLDGTHCTYEFNGDRVIRVAESFPNGATTIDDEFVYKCVFVADDGEWDKVAICKMRVVGLNNQWKEVTNAGFATYRCDGAEVIEIVDEQGRSHRSGWTQNCDFNDRTKYRLTYTVGEVVRPLNDYVDTDDWYDAGVHYYVSREAAVIYAQNVKHSSVYRRPWLIRYEPCGARCTRGAWYGRCRRTLAFLAGEENRRLRDRPSST